jgi:hypothetical protein
VGRIGSSTTRRVSSRYRGSDGNGADILQESLLLSPGPTLPGLRQRPRRSSVFSDQDELSRVSTSFPGSIWENVPVNIWWMEGVCGAFHRQQKGSLLRLFLQAGHMTKNGLRSRGGRYNGLSLGHLTRWRYTLTGRNRWTLLLRGRRLACLLLTCTTNCCLVRKQG